MASLLRSSLQALRIPVKHQLQGATWASTLRLKREEKKQSLKQCLSALQEKFTASQIPEPHVSAEYILAYVLGHKTLQGVNLTKEVSEQQWTDAVNLSNLRLQRMPVQYVLEEWDFLDLTLRMQPPVFIPRPETEEMVCHMLEDPVVQNAKKFLEIGCGSGAISVSLLSKVKQAEAVAIDKSPAACKLTMENGGLCGVQDRLQVNEMELNQELLERFSKYRGPRLFDFVVSNPPYIPTTDMEALQIELKQFEDMEALHGGPDGMDVVYLLLKMAPLVLKPNGSLWLEVDSTHPEKIRTLLQSKDHPHLTFKEVFRDFNGKPRVCFIQYTPPPE